MRKVRPTIMVQEEKDIDITPPERVIHPRTVYARAGKHVNVYFSEYDFIHPDLFFFGGAITGADGSAPLMHTECNGPLTLAQVETFYETLGAAIAAARALPERES